MQTFDLRALGGSFCQKFGWGGNLYFSMTGSTAHFLFGWLIVELDKQGPDYLGNGLD